MGRQIGHPQKPLSSGLRGVRRAELALMAHRSERIQSKLSRGKCGAKSSGRQGKAGSCQGQESSERASASKVKGLQGKAGVQSCHLS